MKAKALIQRNVLPWSSVQITQRCASTAATPEPPKPFESIPGLSTLPLIGPLHHFLPVIGKIGPPDNFAKLMGMFQKEFGSVVKMDGIFRRASMVILFEPEHYDQVFRAEDQENPLRPGFDSMDYYRQELRKDVFGGLHGLTTAQGPQWRDFRTKVNPAFLKPKLVKLYAPGLEEIARDTTARLTRLPTDYLQENFDVEMTKFSLESIGLVGLGDRLGCLRDDVDENHPGRQLMSSAKKIMLLAFKLDMAPSPWRYITTPALNKLVAQLDLQWKISTMYIEQARKRINERGHDIPEEEKSIVEKLLAVDEKVAIMMANEMLMAGIDTVAFATTVILYRLATNQKVQDELREQIKSGDPNRRYLKACLKEALRLNPVITGNLRRTSKEHVVAGYRIPKGVDVVSPNEYLSKQEKYYTQPLEFIPERWLVDKTDPLYHGNAHAMVTLPFGFGVRTCIGRRIAELEIETFVQTLVKDYVVEWNGPHLKVVTRVMNMIKKPYHFEFKAV